MKNKNYWGVGAVLVLVFYALPAAAFTARSGTEAVVSKDETIEGNLIISGQMVTVEGNVKGDVICAGQTVSIAGKVEGDVICAGQTLKVSSEVGGSVRAAAQTIDIAGRVNRNATVAAQTLKLDSEVGQELFFAAQSANIGGRVGGDTAGAADSITLSGNIGRNAQFGNNNLSVKSGAAVGGSLDYTSANEATVETGSTIAAGLRRHEPPADKRMPMAAREKKTFPETVLGMVFKLMFYLLFALLFAAMFRGPVTRAVDAILAKPGQTFGIGFLFLLLTPLASIILMLTLIGIPVAMVVCLFFAVAIFLAGLLAAVAVGGLLARTYFKDRKESLMAQTVIGVVVLWLLFEIPFLNVFAIIAALSWGLGGVYRMLR